MLAVAMSPPIAHYPAVQKRPKLSLQTSELPITYGASSRNVALIATPTATVTPTTLNTFNNTFDLTYRPSPTSATASPTILRSSYIRDRHSRSQSPHPKRHGNENVYSVNLPFGIKPILKNTPFPQIRTNSISASPRSSTRRVFFPAPKKVCFRNVIEEEIVTGVYVARHSDLFERECEEDQAQDKEQERCTETEKLIECQEVCESTTASDNSSSERRTQRCGSVERLGASRAASSHPTDSDSISVTTPAGGRKRRRWEWTLAPVPPRSDNASELEPSQRREEGGGGGGGGGGAKIIPQPRSPAPDMSSGHARPTTSITTNEPASHLPSSSSSSSTPPQAPPQRAASLESSPLKRKAEHLDDVDDNSDQEERKRASTL